MRYTVAEAQLRDCYRTVICSIDALCARSPLIDKIELDTRSERFHSGDWAAFSTLRTKLCLCCGNGLDRTAKDTNRIRSHITLFHTLHRILTLVCNHGGYFELWQRIGHQSLGPHRANLLHWFWGRGISFQLWHQHILNRPSKSKHKLFWRNFKNTRTLGRELMQFWKAASMPNQNVRITDTLDYRCSSRSAL